MAELRLNKASYPFGVECVSRSANRVVENDKSDREANEEMSSVMKLRADRNSVCANAAGDDETITNRS